jgi:dTDP-4-amino-4,6-dideoxygalactose transaminase
MIATSIDSVAGKARQLRQYGWSEKYKIDLLGGRNSRLDAIQAAILNKMLVQLDDENEARRTFSNRVIGEVKNSAIQFLMGTSGSVYHLLVLKTQHRDALVSHLNRSGIESGIHYPFVDSCQVGRNSVKWSANLPWTSVAIDQILTIPMHPYLREDEILRIVDALNAFKISEA